MMQKYSFMLVPLGFLLLSLPGEGQAIPADTALGRQAEATLTGVYKKEIAENLHLYNGSEYLAHGHGVKGFPFFQSAGPVKGSVFYDGNRYDAVDLQYDLEQDNLVVTDYSNNYPICLIREKVSYFIIGGSRFVHLLSGNGLPAPGFYESICSGRVNAWGKKLKKMVLSVNASDNDASYLSIDTWFLEKGAAFFQVGSEHAVLAVLKDKKDLLKKYIRSNQLSFKRDPDTFIARVTGYYNQLTN